jgi:hypothetical protein
MGSASDTASARPGLCIRVHASRGEVLVAACDADLLGRTLREGDIEFCVSPDFYGDVAGDDGLLEKHLRVATIANLVGRAAVACGVRTGVIDEENVLLIAGVPHAQFALL